MTRLEKEEKLCPNWGNALILQRVPKIYTDIAFFDIHLFENGHKLFLRKARKKLGQLQNFARQSTWTMNLHHTVKTAFVIFTLNNNLKMDKNRFKKGRKTKRDIHFK